tara:strand:+ start:490 stop:795 length:306 start_codon:yes stop_codon:yes gene_type:complete
MANIFFADEKLPKQVALNSLTLKIEEYFGGRFQPRAVSDDGGSLLEIQVEVPQPSEGLLEQVSDFPLDEVIPKWAGWRVVVLKVPPTYIDYVTNASEPDDY